MPINPIGEASYNGLGEPLSGDAVVEQENSSNAIRTYIHSSNNTGRFLLGMDYRADKASSLLTDLAVFDIDEDGGFRTLSGTTVKMELNSSGLYAGSTLVVDLDGKTLGGSYKPVVALTTGVNYSPVSSQSGTLFTMTSGNDTSMVILLPKNPTAGTWFEFYVSSQGVSSDVKIDSTLDSSAKILVPGLTSAVSSARVITPYVGTVGSHFIRLTAVSSILWIGAPAYDGGVLTTNAVQNEDFDGGRWAAGNVVA